MSIIELGEKELADEVELLAKRLYERGHASDMYTARIMAKSTYDSAVRAEHLAAAREQTAEARASVTDSVTPGRSVKRKSTII